MEGETAVAGAGGWTDERHAAFLNCMEQSFVRQMLRPPTAPRLDRRIPDSATESNQISSARRSAAATARPDRRRGREESGVPLRERRRSQFLRVCHEPEDQVVPEFGGVGEKAKGMGDEKEA